MRLGQLSLYCIIFTLLSCKSDIKKEIDDNLKQTDSIVDISINLDDFNELYFSSIFDSLHYILLDSNDSLPLVGNMKTIIEGNNIYIEDNELNNLHQFDLNGKQKSIFKSTGEGPTQFLQIEDFIIKNDTVIIYDRRLGKLIYFDNTANFLKAEPEKAGATNFTIGDGNTLFFYSGFGNSDGNIFLRKSNKNSTSSFYPLPSNSNKGGVRLLHGFVENKKTRENSITIPYTYDVATLDSLNNLSNVKRFSFRNIPPEDPENSISQPSKINVYFPIKNQFWISQFFNRKGYHFLLNNENKISSQSNKLLNDIDGIDFFFYPIAKTDDWLVLYTQSTILFNLYNSSHEDIKEKFPNAGIHHFVEDHHDDLIDDRHVLIFLKFKDSFAL